MNQRTVSTNAPPLLELIDVTVTRHPVRILDRLSLTIPQKTHTAILGANGSGKTSLLKLLMRQFYPSVEDEQTGTVRIMGRSDWHIDQLKQQLGIVTGTLDQTFSAGRPGRMTAVEAVLSGFSGVQLVRHMPTPTEAMREAAEEALVTLGASHLSERTLETMSTGERRRTLIARALVHRPASLVLDEPTTGLDIVARHHLLEQLQQIAEAGTTLVLVSHHVEEIIPAIHSVVLLKAGRVLAHGDRETMLTSQTLSDLYEAPIRVATGPHGRQLAEVDMTLARVAR